MENIIELSVKQDLSYYFKQLTEACGGKIINVVQFVPDNLYYIIEADKDVHNKITDYAFMTYIKNPAFQKYYHQTEEFKKIADKFINDKLT